MLFEINQIDTDLKRIEEIPNTFFENLLEHEEFGYELLPDWFREEYGNRREIGLYAKAKVLFDEIIKSGRRQEISEGYSQTLQVEEHCSDVNSQVFYCEHINKNLKKATKDFFDALYDNLDNKWVKDLTGTNVIEYLSKFKRENDLYLCPICGNESLKSSSYEARAALDHWQCKAKYPMSSVHWNNLVPLGEGCNRSPRKGEKEIFWTDNERTQRQKFIYPFTWHGDIKIEFHCIDEPDFDNNYGRWEFTFIGINPEHQDLINKWNVFFEINNRWVSETLKEFLEVWHQLFAQYIIDENHKEDAEVHYQGLLESFRNSKNDININPLSRVHWFFLNFLLEGASEELFDGYKKLVISQLVLM